MNLAGMSNDELMGLYRSFNTFYYDRIEFRDRQLFDSYKRVHELTYLPEDITVLRSFLGDLWTILPTIPSSPEYLPGYSHDMLMILPEFHNAVVDLYYVIKREVLHRGGGIPPSFSGFAAPLKFRHDITGWLPVLDPTPP